MISVDPGVKGCGWALWGGATLIDCGYGEVPRHDSTGLVIELPQVYYGAKQKGDANDLVSLAFAAGKIASRFVCYTTVKPRDWKGTVKKEVMLKRILSKLTDGELTILKGLGLPKSLEHNVVDAVGIGLHSLGRL